MSMVQTETRLISSAPLKFLVVDTERPIRDLLRIGMASQGYEILDAPNGRTALELLEHKPELGIPCPLYFCFTPESRHQ